MADSALTHPAFQRFLEQALERGFAAATRDAVFMPFIDISVSNASRTHLLVGNDMTQVADMAERLLERPDYRDANYYALVWRDRLQGSANGTEAIVMEAAGGGLATPVRISQRYSINATSGAAEPVGDPEVIVTPRDCLVGRARATELTRAV
ncbi:MAG: hypothetical protein HKO62_11000 [Gammaproteobacteria bacterium]|nr:hypothetical protein [Gammaproteobacteria bacterium]NNM01268.1 hypothetical protein [Gammaproteobacteria bacterium]